ncbi:hypothetical protein EVAR_23374_1 [Eumeta japonica]|uniref:Uncharacterized protein n=1 Tax=Eumeta variegata TaxID=151549 RepID=A0A4C1VU92_EUMVA|nr:hypothetical protein EVAR_23374_1 [Eumeta japonica]
MDPGASSAYQLEKLSCSALKLLNTYNHFLLPPGELVIFYTPTFVAFPSPTFRSRSRSWTRLRTVFLNHITSVLLILPTVLDDDPDYFCLRKKYENFDTFSCYRQHIDGNSSRITQKN